MKALRDVFGDTLVSLGSSDPNVLVLDADLANLEVRDGVALPQVEAGCGLAWNKDAVERYRLR